MFHNSTKEFQFLLGRLKTEGYLNSNVEYMYVSIPLRQAKNN